MADGKKIDLTDLGEYISGHADKGRLTASGMNYEAYWPMEQNFGFKQSAITYSL